VSIADGVLIAVDVNQVIYALDARSGQMLWISHRGREIDSWFYSSPLIVDGVVYSGLGNAFTAVRLENGKEIWKVGGMGESSPGLGSPAFIGHAIAVSFYSAHGLFALDPADGSVLWNNKSCIFGFASPVYNNGMVYIADYYEGNLVALDARTGNEIWRRNCGGR
jgi:outer membrane protein assembly factor BamB